MTRRGLEGGITMSEASIISLIPCVKRGEKVYAEAY